MTRRLTCAVLAATLIILAGCGGSDETPLKPADENPFRALVAGTDSTLDIATWNLHGFAESAETVDLVADAIVAMNLDVVALQEIAASSRFTQLIQQPVAWNGFYIYRQPHRHNLGLEHRVDHLHPGDSHHKTLQISVILTPLLPDRLPIQVLDRVPFLRVTLHNHVCLVQGFCLFIQVHQLSVVPSPSQ